MNIFVLIIIWILFTLLISASAVLLGKKYGVSYPIAIFASLVVLANILAVKVVSIGGITAPAGVLVFSSTFLITDSLSELWGKEEARKAV